MSETVKGHISAQLARRPLVILFAVVFLAWLPGFFTLPPLDRDESRFAQATKQMLETGDFVSIRLGEEARDQKPVGIYWLQAASTGFFGLFLSDQSARTQIWTYRVPSFLGAFATVALIFFLVRGFAGVPTAFTAALLLGLTVLLMSEMKIAKTDAVLLAAIVAVQSTLMRLYLSARRDGGGNLATGPPTWQIMLAWAAFAFGILVKGPIVILICGATLLGICLWDRDWRWLSRLRPLWGMAITLIVVLPWAVAIYFATDGEFYRNSLGQDFAMKLAGGQEAHAAPPGYYTLLAPVTFWPATLILVPAIVFAIRNRHEPPIRYLLVWVAVTWLMFEAAPTKLPHYVLPAYPALAILGALWLGRAQSAASAASVAGAARSERIASMVSLVLFAIVGLVLTVSLLGAPLIYGGSSPAWAYAVAALALAAMIAAMAALWRQRHGEAIAAAAICAMLLYGVAGLGTVPALQHIWLSPRLAEAVQRHTLPGDPPVTVAGYAEPSARFLLGTSVRLETGTVAGGLAAAQGGVFAVEVREQSAFFDALGGTSDAMELERVEGLNYSNGREMTLILYRVTPARL